jgi:hypothetical protein
VHAGQKPPLSLLLLPAACVPEQSRRMFSHWQSCALWGGFSYDIPGYYNVPQLCFVSGVYGNSCRLPLRRCQSLKKARPLCSALRGCYVDKLAEIGESLSLNTGCLRCHVCLTLCHATFLHIHTTRFLVVTVQFALTMVAGASKCRREGAVDSEYTSFSNIVGTNVLG